MYEVIQLAVVFAGVSIVVLIVGQLYYSKRRLEHQQIMAAIDKGTALSEVGLARPTTPWIRNLTWGVALLIVGIGLAGLWWNAFGEWMGAGQGWNAANCLYIGPFILGLVVSAVGVSLIVRGLLRRAAERKAMALASGVALSEIERPRPIASYSIGTGLLVIALLLLVLMQNYEGSGYMPVVFAVSLALGVGLTVRGCLLRKVEKRFLSKEKGLRLSNRRRAKLTKSILVGIGLVLFSLVFLYSVVQRYRQGDHDFSGDMLFFSVLFTVGVVFLIRALLLRQRRPERTAQQVS